MFVEKPLGITAKESREMAEAIEQAELLFTTGYFMRTDPKHLFLKEQVANGAFGKITRARGWNCHSGSLGGWFDDKPDRPSWRWMADPKIAGVGGFGDLGTHSLDILMWILGDVASVTAEMQAWSRGATATATRRARRCSASRTASIGTLAAGWVDVANPVTLQISGTEGHAVIVNDKLYFESKKVAGRRRQGAVDASCRPAPKAPLHQFVDAVLGHPGQPLVKPREAAERVAVMEAMYRSARTGQWTPVA